VTYAGALLPVTLSAALPAAALDVAAPVLGATGASAASNASVTVRDASSGAVLTDVAGFA
jgi:hypothetical protein